MWQGVETLRDPDLAAHITIVGQRGVCLQGQPIAAVFPAVPPADYVHSVLGDVHDALANIAGNPVYAVLNCCRVHWYLCEGQICSKDEAGSWALGTLPSVFQPLIRQALARYRGEAINAPFARADLQRFAACMREHIHSSIPTD
jgi:streptomycin 3"-adenylyltransferase